MGLRAGVSGWKQVVGVLQLNFDKAGVVDVGIVGIVLGKVGLAGTEANAQRLVLQVTPWSRVA